MNAINDYAGSFQRNENKSCINKPCRCANQVAKNNGGGGGGIAKVCVNEPLVCECET